MLGGKSEKSKPESIVDKRFIWQLILQGLFLGVMVSASQKYFESFFAPSTALQNLRNETNLNAKLLTYQDAIKIVLKHVESLNFGRGTMDDPIRIKGEHENSEIQVNLCYAKLCLYSDNKDIPIYFSWLLSPTNTPIAKTNPGVAIQKFIKLIRDDLHNGDMQVDSTKYVLMFQAGADSAGKMLPIQPKTNVPAQ